MGDRPAALVSSALRPAAISPVIKQVAAQDDEPSVLEAPVEPLELPPAAVTTLDGRPITLISVLEVVDQDNPNINIARHRIEEAYAVWQRAESLWLPSIRGGFNYNKHEGRIQDVIGENIETSRGAMYAGLGAGAIGAGSPVIPGLYANFHLADAVFQPRIAGQMAAAREASAEATVNDFMFQAAQAYLELLRAEQERAIAEEIRDLAGKLAKLTESYAQTGQGLAADDDRARTEWNLRKNDVLRAEESVRVASARLAQLLRLDPTTPLVPQEPALVPLHLFGGDEPLQSLVAHGLSSRPEARESRALVGEAVNRLERERFAPLIPSVLLGISEGAFGAGRQGDLRHFADRFDADVFAWWELRNLGQGDAAARKEKRSQLEQARWREVAMLDQIAREIVEAHAQIDARRKQLEIAQSTVGVARGSYEKNLDRIQNAQGLPVEALQSIQALAQAERELLRVVTDYNLAQFSLQRATGSLPDFAFEKTTETSE